jgi:hypothetical protein
MPFHHLEQEQQETEEGALEIKDAVIIFNNVWSKLEAKYGKQRLQFPKEIIWLMGKHFVGSLFASIK